MQRLISFRYLYPTALRKRLSDVWGEDVTRWWLPNDEGYPTILQAIREFLEYRALAPQDNVATDLRDMKGLFSALSLEDAETREGKSTSTAGTDSDRFEFWGGEPGFDSSPDMQNWM